jgi:hypothetical protein
MPCQPWSRFLFVSYCSWARTSQIREADQRSLGKADSEALGPKDASLLSLLYFDVASVYIVHAMPAWIVICFFLRFMGKDESRKGS